MQQYLLSCLLFTPLVAAFVALFIPSGRNNFFRYLAVLASVAQLGFLFGIIMYLDPNHEGLQGVERASWITLDLGTWGILKAEYFVGLDGLNFPIVALAVFVMLVAVISSWSINKNIKGYFIL